MIGVIANPELHAVVREFFELFKTPWEFCRPGFGYDVILCTNAKGFEEKSAPLVLIYSSEKLPFDTEKSVETGPRNQDCVFAYKQFRLPIYGDSITFRNGSNLLLESQSKSPAIYSHEISGRVVTRIGYDLFAEVLSLLTKGQPVRNAAVPTLDLHIELLRDLIRQAGQTLVEIPPIPDGYRFIVCLTHDVDHPSVRQHKLDHTMFGFLYRALLGSVFGLIRGRIPFRHLVTNWAAAFKLAFIHLGLADDPWSRFDAYATLEEGLHSTFFVIPFKNSPGRTKSGKAPRIRASRYETSDIAAQIRKLISAGCEIGLHGIDAWMDSLSAQKESEQIRDIAGTASIGVRMHWLYNDEQAPATLETAGLEYDSTVGYNETIGYRAGTTQAYKPLGAARLLELPLHIMDTALFYPAYLDLSAKDAKRRVGQIIDNAVEFGGSVTINWHDRSLSPERLWGDFYVEMIDTLRDREAWFPTASKAVSWFRKRRSVVFETLPGNQGGLRVKVGEDENKELPGLRLRVYRQGELPEDIPITAAVSEQAIGGTLEPTVDAFGK